MKPIEVRLQDQMFIVDVAVSRPGLPVEPNYRGLIDTGATGTLVSPQVIDELQVPAYGKTQYITANGQVQPTDMYVLSVSLRFPTDDDPNNDAFFQMPFVLRVLNLGSLNPKYDVLLGMDFLSQFHIELDGDLALIRGSATAHPL